MGGGNSFCLVVGNQGPWGLPALGGGKEMEKMFREEAEDTREFGAHEGRLRTHGSSGLDWMENHGSIKIWVVTDWRAFPFGHQLVSARMRGNLGFVLIISGGKRRSGVFLECEC